MMIRPMDSSIKVQLSINASFELEPTLGSGEALCISEISVGGLARAGSTYRMSGNAWRPGDPYSRLAQLHSLRGAGKMSLPVLRSLLRSKNGGWTILLI